MKKALTAAVMAAFALAVLAAAGGLLYRHFVTNRIMDGGDTANPFLPPEEVSPLLPEGSELVSLFWIQNAMNYDDSFCFSLSGGWEAPVLACSFTGENGGRLELGGDDAETGEPLPPVAVACERWKQAEGMLREMSLPAYQSPDPNLSDAGANRIDVTWRNADGTECSAAFDGTDAAPLLELLKEMAEEVAAEEYHTETQ